MQRVTLLKKKKQKKTSSECRIIVTSSALSIKFITFLKYVLSLAGYYST